MTPLQETLDEIARLTGWRRFGSGGSLSNWWGRGKDETFDHPVPATLDAIAGLMPKGWKWGVIHSEHGTFGWASPPDRPDAFESEGTSELEVRALVALAVLRHKSTHPASPDAESDIALGGSGVE